ncbi:MAG: hypothetical protein NTU81_02980 [Candidatus Nomurabacteria bacterium]|nr:hypothetical protein [Candidatus Nomurabacteria bacterium]
MCTDYLLPSFKEILGLSPGKTTFENLELMWVPIASYILINLDICLAISVKRRLKRFNKGGLVFSTVNGLTNGLIVGLIMGIPIGVISFFIYKVDFLSGIYFGLLCGVFFNLVLSLFYEFKKGLLIEFK